MAQLAPLLAENGIDLNNLHVDNLDQLQEALNSAVERHNMSLHTPVGPVRKKASMTLSVFTDLVSRGAGDKAAAVLNDIPAEAPDGSPSIASCLGVATDYLDRWLGSHDSSAPTGLRDQVRLPAGHWEGERAAKDILALARKGRAFSALDKLTATHGGLNVFYGSALAVAGTMQTWAVITDQSLTRVCTDNLA